MITVNKGDIDPLCLKLVEGFHLSNTLKDYVKFTHGLFNYVCAPIISIIYNL